MALSHIHAPQEGQGVAQPDKETNRVICPSSTRAQFLFARHLILSSNGPSVYFPTVYGLTSVAAHLFRTLPMDDSANTEELKPADGTSNKVLRPTAEGANPKEPMLANSAHRKNRWVRYLIHLISTRSYSI